MLHQHQCQVTFFVTKPDFSIPLCTYLCNLHYLPIPMCISLNKTDREPFWGRQTLFQESSFFKGIYLQNYDFFIMPQPLVFSLSLKVIRVELKANLSQVVCFTQVSHAHYTGNCFLIIIYVNQVFFFHLYSCETWTNALSKEHNLQIS